MVKIIFHKDALIELRDSATYLNEQSPEAGDKFIEEVDKCLDLISEFPEAWPRMRGNVRRIVVSRYRYNIFYRIIADGNIQVLSVEHGRKRPFGFIDRL